MNRKAMFVLLASSLAFLAAVFLLFLRMSSGVGFADEKFFGEKELKMYEMYYDNEVMMNFIDLSAKYSAEKALAEGNLEKNFKKEFAKYLEEFNKNYNQTLSLDLYDIRFENDSIVGICKKEFSVDKKNFKYTIQPNFRVVILRGKAI